MVAVVIYHCQSAINASLVFLAHHCHFSFNDLCIIGSTGSGIGSTHWFTDSALIYTDLNYLITTKLFLARTIYSCLYSYLPLSAKKTISIYFSIHLSIFIKNILGYLAIFLSIYKYISLSIDIYDYKYIYLLINLCI